ncbi:Protein BZZ1 [Elasticomyces elasticus]|uniref:Protein BZZ1 n=1 Tax=Elasticomyces elasticus TaxID=574655 RepID=A0AAN8A4G9_9PEZI|nr:Protein BZZ1 [Elasticomyces elasticus]
MSSLASEDHYSNMMAQWDATAALRYNPNKFYPSSTPQRKRGSSFTHIFPPSVKEKYHQLAQLRKEGAPLAAQWSIIQSMAQEEDAGHMYDHKLFSRAYISVVLNACKDVGGVSVSEAIALIPVFGIRYTDLYARCLWQLAKALLYDRAGGTSSSQSGLILDEMMGVWYLALSARLRRQNTAAEISTTARESYDWSFLPPTPALTELISQRARNTKHASNLSFTGGLALLLPELRSDQVSQEFYDYASPAFVTLDALRSASNDVREGYSAFAEVLEVMVAKLHVLEIPPALRHELAIPREESSLVRAEVEALVKRTMGAKFVPRSAGKAEVVVPASTVGTGNGGGEHKDGRQPEVGVIEQLAKARNMKVRETAASAVSDKVVAPEPVPLPTTSVQTASVTPQSETETSQPQHQQHGKMLFAYEATGDGELTIADGQYVEVLETDGGDGWVRVRIASITVDDVEGQEREGYVPASYLEILEPSDASTQTAVHEIKTSSAASGDRAGARDMQAADSQVVVAANEDASASTSQATSQETDGSRTVPGEDSIQTSTGTSSLDIAARDAAIDRFTNLRINRLGQAQQKQDLNHAEILKREILDFASHSILPDKLYDHLLLTLLTLRSPTSAIEVWTHFLAQLAKRGRQPEVKSYTVMMKGTQILRDLPGQEAFWSRMRAAGLTPDVNAWTTRIFGLIKGGRAEDGLKALGEMGGEWVDAVQAKHAREAGGPASKRKAGTKIKAEPEKLSTSQAAALYVDDVDDVPRPTAVTMNAAISALAMRADRHIPKVLAWGRAFGLEPDGTTYNTLLNVSFRHGDIEEAMAILRRMREKGIETSSDTWIVLLTQVFEGRSMDGLSAQEQRERVMGLIEAGAEGGGSGIDAKGYALAIDRLLKGYGNVEAAQAVLGHMVDVAGLQPTPHLYTIFMTYYFSREGGPDLAAVAALWEQIQREHGGRGAKLDGVFYDRMLEGYATYHHILNSTQEVQALLARMRDEGRRPSWVALERVARALADRGEWGVLLGIVDEARAWVREEDGGRKVEMLTGDRTYGQESFWQFVVDTGLLREEGISSVAQLRRARTDVSPMERRMGISRENSTVQRRRRKT